MRRESLHRGCNQFGCPQPDFCGGVRICRRRGYESFGAALLTSCPTAKLATSTCAPWHQPDSAESADHLSGGLPADWICLASSLYLATMSFRSFTSSLYFWARSLRWATTENIRSEEHTSELQSP